MVVSRRNTDSESSRYSTSGALVMFDERLEKTDA
jgi:hypothetical protein